MSVLVTLSLRLFEAASCMHGSTVSQTLGWSLHRIQGSSSLGFLYSWIPSSLSSSCGWPEICLLALQAERLRVCVGVLATAWCWLHPTVSINAIKWPVFSFRFQPSPPPESDFFCLLASAFRSNRKNLKKFCLEFYLLSAERLGLVGVCSTGPETEAFFLSNIRENCCPEKWSHFLCIAELTKWQSLGPHSGCCTQCSIPLQGIWLWICALESSASLGSVSFWHGKCLPREWSFSSHTVQLGSFWQPWTSSVRFQSGSLDWLP